MVALIWGVPLFWLRAVCPDDPGLLTCYAQRTSWRIILRLTCFGVSYRCSRREMAFLAVLTVEFLVWLVGLAVHQWFLK